MNMSCCTKTSLEVKCYTLGDSGNGESSYKNSIANGVVNRKC